MYAYVGGKKPGTTKKSSVFILYTDTVPGITVSLNLTVCFVKSNRLLTLSTMGQKEKALIVGFVALIASASGFAHFYVTQEGYAGVARKQREGSDKQPQQQPNASAPPGGVWKNMGQRRDALGGSGGGGGGGSSTGPVSS